MFYERLKGLCDKNGLTISSFAILMGGSKGTPSNWKRGAIPNSDIVIKAAKYFSVSTDYLLGLSESKSINSCVNSDSLSLEPDEMALIEALRLATPTAKATAVASMYSILGVLSCKQTPMCSRLDTENEHNSDAI